MSNSIKRIVYICVTVFFFNDINAQAIRNYTLEVSCLSRVYNATQSILEFKWPYRTPTAVSQVVYRKDKEILGWDSAYRILGVNDSTFNDTIITGSQFEYKFEKDSGVDGYIVTGYVMASSKLPALTYRGKILMVVDSTHKSYLENDIRTYRNDLIGDGWFTELVWFDSFTSVDNIKSYIVGRYASDPNNLKSVVIIGNISVPYTGNFSAGGIYPPDGHTTGYPPSHEGAWSTDYYYACMDNPYWTDTAVTNNLGARAANRNNPNDGKFDFTAIDIDISALNALQVGRIDLSQMPAFALNERDLLKQYFYKNHQFKHREVSIRERCLIDDNWGILYSTTGIFDEHFANNAYRNMSALIADSVCVDLDYLSTLDTDDYLWSFGFGAGSYTNMTGVGNTGNFADTAQTIKSVFSGFMGSYFGDWDNADNFLRAPLAAKGNVLNTFYCGRPHYYFHHMGLGETIGYSVLRTQNNFDTMINFYLYPTTAFSGLQIHVNLLGDPSVRMQTVFPASLINAYQDSCNNRVKIEWNISTDTAVHTYYVFRAPHIDSSFSLLGTTDSNRWVDSFPLNNDNVYMIRGEKLQFSGSGSYYNLSQGIFDTVRLMQLSPNNDTSICLNETVRLGKVQNLLSNVVYSWIPVANNRDTFTLQITSSGNKILIATDTAGGCVLRDTFNVSTYSLPVSETISSITNSCVDSVVWNSTLTNGGGYIYNWTFPGGNPGTLSGHLLNNPDTVVYPATGTYLTRLTVVDSLTLCENTDTQSVTVICSSLPINHTLINCVNTIKGKEIRLLVYENEKYREFILEAYIGDQWVYIKTVPLNNDQYYQIPILQLSQNLEIRVIARTKENQLIDLGSCNWTDDQNEWSLYPNPVESSLQITYNGINGNQTSEVSLINAYGALIYTQSYVFNENYMKIAMKDMMSGIYTVLIKTGDRIQSFKIVKN